jgi:dephospho-CoA kinase
VRVFGLTGGIASGKSAVLEVFRREGVGTVDADEMSRLAVAPGSDGLRAIVEAFGEGARAADGSLDRKRVGEIVFADPNARKTLNAIVHPRVAAASQERFVALESQGFTLGCYDAALLVENGLADAFRPLVVVAAPRALQKARMVARDRLTEQEADARIDAQAPLEAKLAAADVVIWNDADLATLEARAKKALDEVKARIAG